MTAVHVSTTVPAAMSLSRFAEAERLYERSVSRDDLNEMVSAVAVVAGSKTRAAVMILGAGRSAGHLKAIVDGTCTYSDSVIEAVLKVHAQIVSVPKVARPAAANDDFPVSRQTWLEGVHLRRTDLETSRMQSSARLVALLSDMEEIRSGILREQVAIQATGDAISRIDQALGILYAA